MSALQEKTVSQPAVMFMAMELSNRTWRLVFGDGSGKRRHQIIEAGDWLAFAQRVEEAKEKFHLPADGRLLSVYEASRDGFWIHRRLVERGIENRIIDSASIEVNRRLRRAKTDRVDGDKLLELLRLDYAGQKALRVVRVPTVEEEDRRHLHRERERLQKEYRSLVNRVFGLLALHGIKPRRVGGSGWGAQVASWCDILPRHRYQELVRDNERMGLIERQLKAVDAERQALLAEDRSEAMDKVHRLLHLRGIGEQSAWVFVMECFGWRRFRNRRELAASVGITGTPHTSGDSQREQGISKAGNQRMRHMLIEIAWCWRRDPPDSALTNWYQQRFAGGGKRLRRIGIVALARRLLIALWRYVEQGIVPTGAQLKEAGA